MSTQVLDWNSPVTSRSIAQANKHHLEREIKTEHEAESLLARHAHFRGQIKPIRFRCMNRSLVVSGDVDSYYLKQLAQEALRGLEGVDRIDNRIVVITEARTDQREQLRHPT